MRNPHSSARIMRPPPGRDRLITAHVPRMADNGVPGERYVALPSSKMRSRFSHLG